MRKIVNKFINLLKGKGERFLVIEELENGLEVTRAKVNAEDKKIYIQNSGKADNFEELKKPIFPVDKLVLALSSSRAATIESVVRLKRSQAEELITEGELDTLAFRGLWEFLNRYRPLVAKKLRLTDLDLVLAHAEIRDAGLGSYRVFNPLGFKGSRIFFRFRGTFIPRNLLGLAEKLRGWTKDFILMEGGGIIALCAPPPADYLIQVGETKSALHIIKEDECRYLKDIIWGTGRIMKTISAKFSVDIELAPKIFEGYIKKRLSKKINQFISKEIKKELDLLFGAALKPVSYFHFRFPFNLTKDYVPKRQVRLLNFRDNLERQGYDVIIKQKPDAPLEIRENVLAFLSHPYILPQYQFLNQLLERRAKWLTAH